MERVIELGRLAALRRRPVVTGEAAVVLAAAYFTFLGNTAFWAAVTRALGGVGGRPGLLAAIAILVFVTFGLLATLVNFKGVFKPAIATLLLVSVVLDHFMRAHGIVIDTTMAQSTAETDAREVLELITPRLLLHFLVLGVLPVAILLRAEIRYRKPLTELAVRLGTVLAGLVVLGAIALGCYKDLAGFARNNHQLRHVITPFNYIAAIKNYVRREGIGDAGPLGPLGADARLSAVASGRERPKLIVLVIGETARAANFSLNGYARQTDPELSREDIVSYTRFHSCGTSTASSLPCMFSGLPRREYDDSVARHRENLLDVVQHAGVRVLWRENNTGCKGVCDRVPAEILADAALPEYCSTGECFDEILLHDLDRRLSRIDADTLIVLHQKGSHGPAYHLRYPPAFRRFLPVCETNDLHECTREAIVNAYDNTILYTDHVLAQVIGLLRRHADRLDAGFVYVSDHGESLGEGNVYLHGLPYSIAPDEQTRVPFIVWFSRGLETNLGLDRSCIASGREEPASHDNLFHTVLGLMEVETRIYEPELDLFVGCR